MRAHARHPDPHLVPPGAGGAGAAAAGPGPGGPGRPLGRGAGADGGGRAVLPGGARPSDAGAGAAGPPAARTRGRATGAPGRPGRVPGPDGQPDRNPSPAVTGLAGDRGPSGRPHPAGRGARLGPAGTVRPRLLRRGAADGRPAAQPHRRPPTESCRDWLGCGDRAPVPGHPGVPAREGTGGRDHPCPSRAGRAPDRAGAGGAAAAGRRPPQPRHRPGPGGHAGAVKKHVSHIFDKLGAANRTQAVAHARKLGLIT